MKFLLRGCRKRKLQDEKDLIAENAGIAFENKILEYRFFTSFFTLFFDVKITCADIIVHLKAIKGNIKLENEIKLKYEN